ncbi:MAG TPA: biopolymer transporter ExbB, partial [Maribacter sp.]|nr:biopolymer transporter ExbB [Maribacter sp.]
MLLFQDLAQDASEELLSEEKTLSVIDLIFNGGTGSVIIITVLFIMLGVALYIYFERLLAVNAASKIDKNFMNQIRDYVTSGKLDAAKILCAQTDSPVARLTEKGVSRIGKPLDDINTAIENAGTLEVY